MKYTFWIVFVCLVCVGCGNNNIIPVSFDGSASHPDRMVLRFRAIKPLETPPIVEYTVAWDDTEGVKKVVLSVLRTAASETPKAGVHRAEVEMVEMIDDRRFRVSIPEELSFDYYTHFWLESNNLFSAKWSGKPNKESQTEESEGNSPSEMEESQ